MRPPPTGVPGGSRPDGALRPEPAIGHPAPGRAPLRSAPDPAPDPAFTRFVATSAPRLRSVLTAHYGAEVGADAAGEALAHAWQHWDRVRAMGNLVGYLYRVGQTAAQADLRRGRVPDLPPVPPTLVEVVDPALPRALTALSDQQRVAVLLVHAHGWTLDEAATAMGVRISTVRNHLRRGLARLRRLLEDHDG